jgi:prophage antirepressor-like protein
VQYREPPKQLEPIEVDTPTRAAAEPQSMAAEPKAIEFNGRKVRVVFDEAGEPWFVAKDLVEAVGATWSGHSLDHIPAEYRGMVSVSTPSGTQQMVCLNESGMNFYLIRSDKPAALPLQKKLASEVLPQIRRTGQYVAPGAVPQLAPAAVDYGALGTAVASAVVSAIREILPQRRSRARIVSANQQVLPNTEDPVSEPTEPTKPAALRKDPTGNPRLAAIPEPSTVKDPSLMPVLRNMIDVYGQVTGCFDEAYHLVYDAVLRDPELGPELKKREHGTRIQYIGSQSKRYQRGVLVHAYNVLVKPYLRAA